MIVSSLTRVRLLARRVHALASALSPQRLCLWLAMGLALSAPQARAEITGYTPEAQSMGFLCGLQYNTICYGSMALTDQTYSVSIAYCSSYSGTPQKCASSSSRAGRSSSPSTLAQASFQAIRDVQTAFGDAYYAGSVYLVGYGGCHEEPYNGPATLTACDFYYQKMLGNGTAGNPYRLDGIQTTQARQLMVLPANMPTICQGYVPGLGCPTTAADRTFQPTAKDCGCDPSQIAPPALITPSEGNPISVVNGSKMEERSDLAWPIAFTRSYSSARITPYALGNWRHSHESSAVAVTSNSAAMVPFVQGLGFKLESEDEVWFYRGSSSAAFIASFPEHKIHSAAVNADGYLLSLASGETRQYSANGQMAWKKGRSGYRLDYAYNAAGQLAQITDPFGRGLTLAYTGSLLTQVATSGVSQSDTMVYGYASGALASATFNGTETVSYGYTAGKLTSVTDPLGKTYAQFAYNAAGQAIQSKHIVNGAAIEQVDMAYTASATTVTKNGANSVYNVAKDSQNYRRRVTSATLGASAGNYSIGYGASGKSVSFTTGSRSRSSAMDAATLLPSTITRSDSKVVSLTWDAPRRLLTRSVEPSPKGARTTDYSYDSDGNATGVTVASSSGETRSRSAVFNSLGRIASATGVDGSVTSYDYFPDTDSLPENRGQLRSVTNPLGQTATVNAYAARGNIASATDESGAESIMTYDARGRLLTQTRLGVGSTYAYDLAGQLTSMASSNGETVTMSYDDAHRLVSAVSSTGDSIAYAYDAYSNPIKDSVYKASALARQVNRTFTALGQLKESWGAAVAEKNSATYDANGMPTGTVDGIGRAASATYNANAVLSGYNEKGMYATLTRDADDNLTAYNGGGVTGTTYAWNDFKELLTLSSPDSGSETRSYDPVNRVATRVDASGAQSVATMDALGRLVSLSRQRTGATTRLEQFAYDTAGVGQLASVTDPASTQTWTWSAMGQPLTKTQSAQGVALELAYAYDAQGQLVSIMYPSGMIVGYAWANGRVSDVLVNGQPFINGIGYAPMSDQPVSWTWAAGGVYAKTLDASGKITGVTDSGVLQQATVFDGAMRLTSLSDYGLNLFPTYSAGDQLSGVTANGLIQSFTFDGNWNRASKRYTDGTNESFYMISQTNKINSKNFVGSAQVFYAYDALNNTVNNGRGVFAYDLASNLSQATVSGVVSSYTFNAFKQRVSKTVGGVTTLFLYDDAGNLAGEYDAAGAAQSEHFYLGDLPVGVSSGGSVNAVHTDYLGTPRVITSGATTVWKWESTDPFGVNAPSVQSLVYNQRFPGQYYDAETGLHYNHHRTYDHKTGRYMQPDPLGLAAGKNPFNYVNQNPLNATDSSGLDIEVIHIVDNTMKGWFIDHIALLNTTTGIVSEGLMGESPLILSTAPPFKTSRFVVNARVTRQDFMAKYKGLKYESVTLSSTEEQANKIPALFASMMYPRGVEKPVYGVGNGYLSCVSSSDITLAILGYPYVGAKYPSDFFKQLRNSEKYRPFIKKETTLREIID